MSTMSEKSNGRVSARNEMGCAREGIGEGLSSRPRSDEIAQQGIATSRDFVLLMGAIIADLSSGAISPRVANSMVAAGSTMLKAVELTCQYRHLSEKNRLMDFVPES